MNHHTRNSVLPTSGALAPYKATLARYFRNNGYTVTSLLTLFFELFFQESIGAPTFEPPGVNIKTL